MKDEQKSQTTKTVERLRAIADELEALADDLPHLTWFRAFRESLWNGGRATIHGTGCFYKVMVDENNVGQANHVWVGRNQASATVDLDHLRQGINVLYIQGLTLCHLSHVRDEVCKVVKMLPANLRCPIYKRMARVRMDDRAKTRRKREELRQRLRELE